MPLVPPETDAQRAVREKIERGEIELIPMTIDFKDLKFETLSWSRPDADPIQDIRDMAKRVLEEPMRGPAVPLHNPKCRAVKTQNSADCNCIPAWA